MFRNNQRERPFDLAGLLGTKNRDEQAARVQAMMSTCQSGVIGYNPQKGEQS